MICVCIYNLCSAFPLHQQVQKFCFYNLTTPNTSSVHLFQFLWDETPEEKWEARASSSRAYQIYLTSLLPRTPAHICSSFHLWSCYIQNSTRCDLAAWKIRFHVGQTCRDGVRGRTQSALIANWQRWNVNGMNSTIYMPVWGVECGAKYLVQECARATWKCMREFQWYIMISLV